MQQWGVHPVGFVVNCKVSVRKEKIESEMTTSERVWHVCRMFIGALWSIAGSVVLDDDK
jgi:hypothetical protein